MRRYKTARFAASLALGVFLSTSGVMGAFISPAQAKTSDDAKPEFLGFAGAFLAARIADMENDTGNAISFYRTALEFDPQNTQIKQRLMIGLFTDGRFADGVALAQTLKDDPGVGQIARLALTLDAIGKREYRKATTILNKQDSNPIDRLLNTLIEAWAEFGDGKGEAAIQSITALKGPPWYPVFTNYQAGAMALAMGNKAQARKYLSDIVANPQIGGSAPDTYVRAAMKLARLEAREGNKRAAFNALAAANDFSPDYAPIEALRQSIEKGAKPEVGIKTAQQGAASVLFTLGAALNRDGAEDTVSVYLQFARELDPTNASTLVILGSLKERLGKTKEAIELYQAVPETSPMRRVSELQLGLALADTGQTEEAKTHLKALIAADPKNIRSYIAYGSVLANNKDYTDMAKTYEQAIAAVGPVPTRNDWNLFFQAGIAHERLKQWPKAEALFKRALELYPNQPQVMNYLGYSWIDMNINLKEGMKMIRNAVELRPNDGYIVDSLGWAYYRLGQYDDAVRELERAVELKPADPTINDHLGDAYWRVGRKLEATFQWKRVLINNPEDDLKAKVELKLKKGLSDSDTGKPTVANTNVEAPAKPDANKAETGKAGTKG